jgi:hypothetical protein
MNKKFGYRAFKRKQSGQVRYKNESRSLTNNVCRYTGFFVQYLERKVNARFKYGFAVSLLDPIFYNLVYRNPQWTMLNKNIQAVKCIFSIHSFTAKVKTSLSKLYIHPLTNEVIEYTDFMRYHYDVGIECSNCSTPIRVNLRGRQFNHNTTLCQECRIKIKTDFSDKLKRTIMADMIKLKTMVERRRETLDDDLKKYIARNR